MFRLFLTLKTKGAKKTYRFPPMDDLDFISLKAKTGSGLMIIIGH
jgi:hypothetical protein